MPLNDVDMQKAFETRFDTQWTAAHPEVPIKWEAIPFDPPVTLATTGERQFQPYITMLVQPGIGQRANIGVHTDDTGYYQFTGQVVNDILIPQFYISALQLNTVVVALGYVNTIKRIWNLRANETFTLNNSGRIIMRTASETRLGVRDGYFVSQVRTTYRRDGHL